MKYSIADRENVDAVIIAGDLFDVFNPPNESAELFFKTCKRLSNNGLRAVIAIAGNHDSPERIEAPEMLARECGIVFSDFRTAKFIRSVCQQGLALTQSDRGFVELKLPNYAYPLRLFLTPMPTNSLATIPQYRKSRGRYSPNIDRTMV